MRTIVCVDCKATVPGARQRRRCDDCRLKYARERRSVRTLAPGEQIPSHPPGRHLRQHGYVLLRWRVAPWTYVEIYEHRVVGDRVTTEEHVHHINHDRSDNRPENLRPLTAAEHYALHHEEAGRTKRVPVERARRVSSRPKRQPRREVVWAEEAAHLYGAGWSTYEIARQVGRNPSVVYRRLVQMGVPLRKEARVAVPYRERD